MPLVRDWPWLIDRTKALMNQERQDSTRLASLAGALTEATHAAQAGRLRDAELALRQVLNDYPDQPDALQLLGLVAHQSGRTAAGIDLIESALKTNPRAAAFHANVAEMYRRIGNPHCR